jgi:cytosine/adenosine deaminase-related metal-dependent hydrolase
MFAEMRLAALLQKPVHGPRAMPASTVLEMATLGGARALGIDHTVGSIEVGKAADVIIVERNRLHTSPITGGDPVADLVYAHRADDVSTVIVAGRPVVVDRVLMTAQESEIIADAERQRRLLLDRAVLN